MTADQREALGYVAQNPNCNQEQLRRALGWSRDKAFRTVEWLRGWGYLEARWCRDIQGRVGNFKLLRVKDEDARRQAG